MTMASSDRQLGPSPDLVPPSWFALGLGSTATLFGAIASLTSGVVYGVRHSKIRLSPDPASVAFRALAYSTVIVGVSGAATVAFFARALDIGSMHEFRLRIEQMMPRSDAVGEAFQAYTADRTSAISSSLMSIRFRISDYLKNTSLLTHFRSKYQSDAYKMTDIDKEFMDKIQALENPPK